MTNSLTLIQMNTFGTCWVVLMKGLSSSDGAVGVHQTESGSRCTRGLLCIAFQRLFQSSVTRLGLRLIRSGGHSPRVFQTLHNLSDTVSWTITMLSPPKAFKKKRTYRFTLCFSLPPSILFHFPCFHFTDTTM